MPRQERVEFAVSFLRPQGAKIADLRAYVEDAVATWKGSYSPDEPIFELDGDSVKARAARKS